MNEKKKEPTVWNYRGLECSIWETGKGNIYTVCDIGAITHEEVTVLYYGSREKFTKKHVEDAVDQYFKKAGTKPVSDCKHYLQSVKKHYCVFAKSECCLNCDCLFQNDLSKVLELEEEVESLQDEVVKLEQEIEELEVEIER